MNGSTANKYLMERTCRVARKGITSHTNDFNKFNINKYILNFSSFTKNISSFNPRKTVTVTIIDSGASERYGTLSLNRKDKLHCNENMQVSLPNNIIISPTHITYLNLPNFPNMPRAALKIYLFPDAHDEVLLSLSQFCDHGYKFIFNSKNVCVLDKNKIIFKSYRGTPNGM